MNEPIDLDLLRRAAHGLFLDGQIAFAEAMNMAAAEIERSRERVAELEAQNAAYYEVVLCVQDLLLSVELGWPREARLVDLRAAIAAADAVAPDLNATDGEGGEPR